MPLANIWFASERKSSFSEHESSPNAVKHVERCKNRVATQFKMLWHEHLNIYSLAGMWGAFKRCTQMTCNYNMFKTILERFESYLRHIENVSNVSGTVGRMLSNRRALIHATVLLGYMV